MGEEATVWAVRLKRGLAKETKGTLALKPDALVFTAADGQSHQRIELSDIRRARKVVASPILMIEHIVEGAEERTAFYFAQPPPLEPSGRTSMRKTRRLGAAYLGTSNRQMKDKVSRWERAVREAAVAARG